MTEQPQWKVRHSWRARRRMHRRKISELGGERTGGENEEEQRRG